MHRILFAGQTYTGDGNESLLDSLLRQGASVPYSCRKGSCGCCASRLIEGEVAGLDASRPHLVDDSHILPCVCRPLGDLQLAPADDAHRPVAVELVDRLELSGAVLELALAPTHEWRYRAGQYIYLIRPDGLSRPYSIVSVDGEDWVFRIHVRVLEDGEMSRWLATAPVGARWQIRGPCGIAYDSATMAERPLLLLATGVGGGAMLALARDALAQGHRQTISFYLGVRQIADVAVGKAAAALASRHENFRWALCCSGKAGPDAFPGRVTQAAFATSADYRDHEIFLCGSPEMVSEARWRAIACGARRDRIHADPFHFAHPRMPRGGGILDGIEADPELWQALERGPGLTRRLQAFYQRVYVDPRLSHFFAGVSIERAVQKQYEFLADLFAGTRNYFGMSPFNAHHWMVISDELFDYREDLFETVLVESGLAVHLTRRWLSLHERLRSEMVKDAPRGLVIEGIEQPYRTQVIEVLDIDSVCDHCGNEILRGSHVRYQYRSGRLHCRDCAAIAIAA